MRRFAFVLAIVLCVAFTCPNVALGQVSSTGTLIGTVADATGAVIAGAQVDVVDDATGAVVKTNTGPDGSFRVASLRPGNYVVTVKMDGFKTGQFRSVKIVVGQIYDLQAKLEVGEVQSTVVIEAGAEVLETASTSIGTTITGKAINTLPLSSRDALDLAILMPGASTTGRARQTSFMGLPKGAINITYDGINAQDNILKSSDGFFTIIRPRIDTVEEFSITTAGQGAGQSTEGAVQINFETTRGGNQYHGGAWWYHRNDFFNSNYYFSNLAGTPRQRQRLNQFGGKVGGPIIKDKAFFFVAMDNYRNPSSQVRTRTILAPAANSGLFEYRTSTPRTPTATQAQWTTCTASSPRGSGGSGPTCTVNLFALAAANGRTLVADPFMASVISAVAGARTAAGVSLLPVPDAHIDSIQFNNAGDATRRFPDVRLDYNPASKHQISFIYHYNYFTSTPDFLNGRDLTYPVAPFNDNFGSQVSNRNQWTASWRYNIAANISNEVRGGLQTAPVSFFPDLNAGIYPTAQTNAGSIIIRPSIPTMTQPFQALTPSSRNTAIAQLIETFSWTKGKHSFTFGATFSELRLKTNNSRASHTATIGLATSNPIRGALFQTGFFPGISSTQLGNARNLYAIVSGMVSAYSGTVSAEAASRQYVSGADAKRRVNQSEFGFYGQDQWRILPTLTFNYGLRWEYQGSPRDPDNLLYRVAGQTAFGISGNGNFFAPGTLSGSYPLYELNGNSPWYPRDMNNWAPNIGLAWTPSMDNKLYNMIFGGPGKTVFRTSYSVTYTREGLNNFNSIAQSNPGFNASIFANSVNQGFTCPATFTSAGTFPGGCLTISNLTQGGVLQSLTTNPSAFPDANSFNILPFSGQSVNVFDQDLAVPLVHNWSVGIQREINPNLVVELRYVGNHGQGLWRQDDLNEVNIFENGFLQEFLNAQNNLNIFRNANPLCGQTGQPACSFANNGLPGQLPLPIMTAAFAGFGASSGFASGGFISNLDDGLAGAFANTLAFDQDYSCNLFGTQAWDGPFAAGTVCAGGPLVGPYPINFFVPNPHSDSGAFRFFNGTHTTYNALQIEARHRPTKGLQFNANYTWSKSLTNYYADSSASFSGFDTLRNLKRNKGISPWDLRHQFKMQLIYELPFGSGKRWNSSNGVVNQIVGGWEISAIQRWQSGRVMLLNGGLGGTVNQNDSGVELVGITAQDLQSMLKIRKTSTGDVFYFPASLIGSNGQANSAFIRPCRTPGAFCQRPFLYGPMFYRADISIIKNIKIWEKVRLEYRAEFLNAFNNINFFYPGSETTSTPITSATSGTFGKVTNAYRDVSTTDDNGGRIIQMVLRIHF